MALPEEIATARLSTQIIHHVRENTHATKEAVEAINVDSAAIVVATQGTRTAVEAVQASSVDILTATDGTRTATEAILLAAQAIETATGASAAVAEANVRGFTSFSSDALTVTFSNDGDTTLPRPGTTVVALKTSPTAVAQGEYTDVVNLTGYHTLTVCLYSDVSMSLSTQVTHDSINFFTLQTIYPTVIAGQSLAFIYNPVVAPGLRFQFSAAANVGLYLFLQ